jgi:hypothetical protein
MVRSAISKPSLVEHALISPAAPDRGQMGVRRGTEREGFEPSNGVNPRYAISSRAHSTALAPLLGLRCASGSPKATTRRPSPLVGFSAMLLLATSEAVSKDIGLIATFIGIGVIVNVIVVFIAVLVRGEHQQNQERR